ncbi:MAG: YkgJ family cysteine cluster protein [Desulfohalobiaceae bacterium]
MTEDQARQELQRLYDRIPSFRCMPGCTDCCGPVPFSRLEWQRVLDKRTGDASLTCPYARGGQCEIYDQRPFICRLMGATSDPKLKCPRGCGPNKPLSARQAHRLTIRYYKLLQAGF